MRPYDLIAMKRDGLAHTPDELQALVRGVVDGSMPDYQVAAWLMAAYLRGLDSAETLALTLAMRDSGTHVDLSGVPGIKVDKHSSGGVGDKTTLIVAPILAAAGVPVLKMSGRGLGFSGGTIDKLEAIPGFRTDLDVSAAVAQVKRIGAALIGQTPALVPADKKLYALRDVTATVESVPLIAASIMSKKLAGGADAVLLDVKVGRGAFMKTVDEAQRLAHALVEIGRRAGVRTTALLTAMEEPLGRAIGNALEVVEACELLTGSATADARLRDLCTELAAHGIVLGDRAADLVSARVMVEQTLRTGAAARKLAEIVGAQGGDPGLLEDTGRLPIAPVVVSVPSAETGFVQAIDAEALGRLVMEIGGGRVHKEDAIDPAVGILLRKKTGDAVEAGESLGELHLRTDSVQDAASDRLLHAYTFGAVAPSHAPLIHKRIEGQA